MTDTENLERQLETAYRSIEELDEDMKAGRISSIDHAELRARSEARAAAIVAELRRAGQSVAEHAPEGSGASAHPPGTATPAQPNPARRPGTTREAAARWSRPLGLAAGAVLVFVAGIGVGMVLGRSSAGAIAPVVDAGPVVPPPVAALAPAADATRPPAPAAIPGHPPMARAPEDRATAPHPTTGAPPSAPPHPVPPPSARLEALSKEVQPESAPTARILAFARLALDEGQRPAAIWGLKRVLAREPRNVEAIVGIAAILSQGRFVDQALARLDEALAIDPKYAPAHWQSAQLSFEAKQDYAAAIRAAETFLGLVPKGADADRARAMLAEARTRAATAPPAPAREEPGAGRPSAAAKP